MRLCPFLKPFAGLLSVASSSLGRRLYLLAFDELVEQRYGETVSAPSILVDEAHVAQLTQHLVRAAALEWFFQHLARLFDNLLHGELAASGSERGGRVQEI